MTADIRVCTCGNEPEHELLFPPSADWSNSQLHQSTLSRMDQTSLDCLHKTAAAAAKTALILVMNNNDKNIKHHQ